jgi:hypothetical protein
MARYLFGFDVNHLIEVQLEVHTAQERVTLPKRTKLCTSICLHPNLSISTWAATPLWQACHPTFVEPAKTVVPIAAKKNSIRHPTCYHDIR